MKKIFILLLITIAVLLFPQTSLAQNANQTIILPQNQVINTDYFASGNTVIISGTINGDAYIAGGNIIVDGTINGDLLAAGGSIDIRGRVNNNVRAAGGQITISGEVGRNVSVAGGSINILGSGRIAGSLAAAGGSINISVPVEREANLAGGQISLGNRIGGNVMAAGPVSLTPGAQIAGDLTYWSNSRVQIPPEATVSGRITQNIPPQTQKPSAEGVLGALVGIKLLTTLAFLISYLIGGLLLLRLTPFFVQRTAEMIHRDLWKSLGVGLIIVIIVPILAFILFITILGIPIAFILLAVYLLAIYLSKIMVSFALGQKILNTKTPTFWGLVLGLLIYGILVLIPLIDWLVVLIVTAIGLGALYLEGTKFSAEVKAKKLM